MKDLYITPKQEVTVFNEVDIIVTSGQGDDEPITTPDYPFDP